MAGAQAAGEVHDAVAPHRLAQGRQGIEQLQRQRAGAGTKLPHLIGLRHLQGLRHLGAQGLAEQGCHLRSGHKITARHALARHHGERQGAEFGTVMGVITQTGGVQSLRHEAVKADPAPCSANGFHDNLSQTDRNIFGRQIGHELVYE